ncbi:hypothetical protein RF11_03589 [Thelohanellus kitauei]|uniref:Serpin domain-containing protein n=1 Tax=Thelohanellus kitauei TaxID=669202 RepID=A0A0C2MZ49_THEKT|nr:hypothetical protein RF11_03589 [Thelohanellus kitauei]
MFEPLRSDFGRMTNKPVFIGTLIQVIHFEIGEYGVNSKIGDDRILGEGDDGDDTGDITHAEQDYEKDEYVDDHSSSKLDSQEDGDLKPRQTAEYSDEEEKRFIEEYHESEDSEDPGDESSHDPEEFLVNGPFLFLIYSSKRDFVFYSAAVTEPNAA